MNTPTPREILYKKAEENKAGFLSGQPRWIMEAMEDYATIMLDIGYKRGYNFGYNEGFEKGFEASEKHYKAKKVIL